MRMWEASRMSCGAAGVYEPADLVVYLQDRGPVLKEKSLVAYDGATGKIAAMGTQAERMTQTGTILVRSPLRQGAVAEYEMAVRLFAFVLRKALGGRPLRKPAVAVCVPDGMTGVEKRALEDAVRQAGAGPLVLSELPAQQLMHALPEQDPKLARKFKVILGIEKADPERYVIEQLSRALGYARRMGISPGRVAELLEAADR